MRVSKEAMQTNNEKIIHEAARLFRQQGIGTTGVAEVMSAAGLTHGGFYRHFKTKDELVAAALAKAFAGIFKTLAAAVAEGKASEGLEAFVGHYLSSQHIANPGSGCPIAALAVEVGHQSNSVQAQMRQGCEQMIELLAEGLEGDEVARRDEAQRLLASLVWSVVLARAGVVVTEGDF
jgi:TetR/AcrR family transcriptional repressor of nem operon